MKSTLLAILLLIIITSCGYPIVIPERYINPELQGYIDTFKIAAEKYGVSITQLENISLIDYGYIDSDDVVGLCQSNFFFVKDEFLSSIEVRYKEILIKKEWWDSKPDIIKLELMFHELGHCVFNMKHQPTGIMRHEMDTKLTAEEWDKMQEEFFLQAKNN